MSDDSRVVLEALRLHADMWLDAVLGDKEDVASKYLAILQHAELQHLAESREFLREHIVRQTGVLERIATALEQQGAAR